VALEINCTGRRALVTGGGNGVGLSSGGNGGNIDGVSDVALTTTIGFFRETRRASRAKRRGLPNDSR
jgi:hypothetical protein